MAEQEPQPENTASFNSGIRIADYVGILEGQAIDAMMKVDLVSWSNALYSLLVIGSSKFNEQDIVDFRKALDEVNPSDISHHRKLQDIMIILNKRLDHYGFLNPKGGSPSKAVYRA